MEDATARAFRLLKEYPMGEPVAVGDSTDIRASLGKLYPVPATATVRLPVPQRADIVKIVTVIAATATDTVTVTAPDGVAINGGTSSSVTPWLTMQFIVLSETQYAQC
jgi:hypothetical protein